MVLQRPKHLPSACSQCTYSSERQGLIGARKYCSNPHFIANSVITTQHTLNCSTKIMRTSKNTLYYDTQRKQMKSFLPNLARHKIITTVMLLELDFESASRMR